MSKIEMMEVNQHTSDEVAKVLADLEAQGVDIAAVGANIEAIKTAMASGGNSVIKSIQKGTVKVTDGNATATATISSVNTEKSVVLFGGLLFETSSSSELSPKGHASATGYLTLESATKVKLTRFFTTHSITVSYTVVECA